MKRLKDFLEGRCWPGHKPVPGKKPYSPGSCVKEEDMEEGYGNHPSQRVDPRTGKRYVPPKSPLGQGVAEEWSKKYKSSINCSHPKGFSQKAHCAGKKKHNESYEIMEMTCPNCGMCETHGGVNESAAAAIAAATAIAKKKSGDYDSEGMRKTPYKNPDSPNRKSNAERRAELKEDLRKWFSKTDPSGDWKRINSKGEAIGPCAREPGEPKPKCMSAEKRASLTKKERAAAVASKRKHDPNPERKGAPINVSNFGKGKISEDMEQLDEKNVPTNPELWSRAKSLARSKFDVYPSAYANGWASKWYKGKGGGWRSESTVVDDAAKYIQEKQLKEDWNKINKQDKTDGLSQKAVNAYRRENPGSKLKTAVTEKNPTGKRASRRQSFCSRMGGMKKRLTNPENARDPDSPINKALRRWNC